MLNRISVASSAFAHRHGAHPQPTRQAPAASPTEPTGQAKPNHQAGQKQPLFAGPHNLRQLQDAFRLQAAKLGTPVLFLSDAKKFLTELGFKRSGENFHGPKGMQVHVDRGIAHGHGDHLDIVQKNQKIKIPVDPSVRFE